METRCLSSAVEDLQVPSQVANHRFSSQLLCLKGSASAGEAHSGQIPAVGTDFSVGGSSGCNPGKAAWVGIGEGLAVLRCPPPPQDPPVSGQAGALCRPDFRPPSCPPQGQWDRPSLPALSRYLYVNSRAWPEDCVISDPLQPPPIAEEIELRVLDLKTMKEAKRALRAHRAYTPSEEFNFIFLDVSRDFVAR